MRKLAVDNWRILFSSLYRVQATIVVPSTKSPTTSVNSLWVHSTRTGPESVGIACPLQSGHESGSELPQASPDPLKTASPAVAIRPQAESTEPSAGTRR